MASKKVFTIGIAGGTGSGKSSIIQKIWDAYPTDTCVLKLDNYYKAHPDLSVEERSKLNFDSPDIFDIDLFIEHVKKIQNLEGVESPVYDFKLHTRSSEIKFVEPKKILIIDGIFALHYPELLKLMDTKLYVQVDADIRILRRVKRDMEVRGRTLDSIIEQYLNTVKPMHEKYVSISKKNANMIIPQGAFNEVAVEMVLDHIRSILIKQFVR